MKWTITGLAIGMVLVAVPLNGQQADEGLKSIEGTYTLVKGEAEGKELPKEDIENSLLIIAGNKHTVKVGGTKIVGTHTVDASKKPKTIDASDTEGPYKDKTVLGIYKVKEGRFAVCFAPPGKERPTEFTTQSGTGVIYHVWQRKKE